MIEATAKMERVMRPRIRAVFTERESEDSGEPRKWVRFFDSRKRAARWLAWRFFHVERQNAKPGGSRTRPFVGIDLELKGETDFGAEGWALRRVNEIAVERYGVEVYKPVIECGNCGAAHYMVDFQANFDAYGDSWVEPKSEDFACYNCGEQDEFSFISG